MGRARRGTLVAALVAVVCGSFGPSASASGAPDHTVDSPRAGYVVAADNIHDITAGWTQPTISCSATSSYAKIVLGLSSAHARYVAGTTFNCVNGKAVGYFSSSLTGRRAVSPGDHMSLSLDYYRGSVEMEISDDTQGWGQGVDVAGTGGPKMTRAVLVVQARTDSTGSRALTRFGTATFDTCTVDGRSLDLQSPQRLVMVTGGGLVRATPSSVSATGDFSVAWKHR